WKLGGSADEAKAFAKHGRDQALLLAGVVHRPTRGIDPAGERRFRHSSPAPYRRKQVIPAYDPVTVADQKYEKIEHLRFYREQARSFAELTPIGIDGIIFEQKQHVSAPLELLPHAASTNATALPAHGKIKPVPRQKQYRLKADWTCGWHPPPAVTAARFGK